MGLAFTREGRVGIVCPASSTIHLTNVLLMLYCY